jgi:hypothetical protein
MVSIKNGVMSVARSIGAVLPASLTRAPLTMPFAPTGESMSRFAADVRPAARSPQLRVREILNNGVLARLTDWDAQLLSSKIGDYHDARLGGDVLHQHLNHVRDSKGIVAARKLYADFRLYNRVARTVSYSGYSSASRAHEADCASRLDPSFISTYDSGLPPDLTWLREASVSLTDKDTPDTQQRNVMSILAAAFPAPDAITANGTQPFWHRSTVHVNYDRSYDIHVQGSAMFDRVMDNLDYFNAVPGLRQVKQVAGVDLAKRDTVISAIVAEALGAKAPDFKLEQIIALGAYSVVLAPIGQATPERSSEVVTFIRDLLIANGEPNADCRLTSY